MARCRVCSFRSPLTASSWGVCAPCLRTTQLDHSLHLARVHARTRRSFGIPSEPPRDPLGVLCDLCANQCRIPSGKSGDCGLRRNMDGRLVGGAPNQGNPRASHLQCCLPDLPVTSWEHSGAALAAVQAAGLTRVRIGNVQLLGEPYGHASHKAA